MDFRDRRVTLRISFLPLVWSHILRRPCGALQNLEEFNRKASVRVRPIAYVHDEDNPVGHDVQVVSGVVGE